MTDGADFSQNVLAHHSHATHAEALAACLKNGCHIALDTDAHSTTQLQGNMPPLLAMLEEMQFPQELVVNATRQNLVNELKLHGRICAEYIGGEIL